jgi:hypothetical protein
MPQSGLLPTAIVVMMWVVLTLAVLILVVSGIVLAGGRRIFPGLRNLAVDPRRLALCGVLLSIFLLMESIPRVAHASVTVVFVMSALALVPMAATFAVYPRRSKPRGAVQHGSAATGPTEQGRVRPPQAR